MHRVRGSVAELSAACSIALMTALLAACGGGGGEGDNAADANQTSGGASSSSLTQTATQQALQDPNAPAFTGNTVVDGLNWINYRRVQTGLPAVTRNGLIDAAAQAHSNYQKLNDTITHIETPGRPGFTGVSPGDRLAAANYVFTQRSYAHGEVISATAEQSGFGAVENLIAAIYHRYAILEPTFKEAGTGSATVTNGYTYFTTNLATNGLAPGIPRGTVVIYPYDNQQLVPTIFFSDREIPDPVPDRNEVGYPVSVHANITATIGVQTFAIRPRGGADLPVRLLTHQTDSETPLSAASIIPTGILAPQTTYEVRFAGTVDGVPVERSWSFRTQ
ncbi:MAG: hypothetical protein JWQ00_2211 [Noviherbaspirillum sp.]|jgi:uncharacterized protein YkwD|nr:hypothetical protein [Noviherbaspirillum sp.]